MKISDILVWPTKNQNGAVKANGYLTIEDVVKLKFVLLDSKNGPFVAFHTDKYEKDGETKYASHVQFTSKELQTEVNKVVLAEFNKRLNGNSAATSAPSNTTVPF